MVRFYRSFSEKKAEKAKKAEEMKMPEAAEQKYVPECYACPIGTASMAVQGAAPDATEHLIRAGREVLGAVRSLLEGMDSFLNTMEERSGATRKDATVQSIPVRRQPKKA
jgi:hypothetical protein